MDLAPGPLNAHNNLTHMVRLRASRNEVCTCSKIQNVPALSIRDERVVLNRVMASPAIIVLA